MSTFMPVYLLRKGSPTYLARRFLASFFRFEPNNDLRLILLLKGFEQGETPTELANISSSKRERMELVYVDDEGMDLTAYRTLCQNRQESHFLFFNSNSRILSPTWHRAFSAAWDDTRGEGLIGASGSYEASADLNLPFPNPHIRTNGFLIAREAFLAAAIGPLVTKKDCHMLESGKQSLTRFFQEKAAPVGVVNADNQFFGIDDWPKSQTFRLEDQAKLLIADNRSEKYHAGLFNRRNFHAFASWGTSKNVASIYWSKTVKRIFWDKLCRNGHSIPLINALVERGLGR